MIAGRLEASVTATVRWSLHPILRPVLAQADNLPLPERNAMQTAFATIDAAAPALFPIASKPTVNEAVT